MTLKPHYSGETSRPFWRAIRQQDDPDQHLYTFACALQEMEERVLRVVTAGTCKSGLEKERET